MANVVRDPREHPEAVLGDFAHPDPLRTFDLDQVAFVYGSRYILRSAATTISRFLHNGISQRSAGCRTTSKQGPIGGFHFTGPATLIDRPAQPATDATP
jgi:hypothetical protein